MSAATIKHGTMQLILQQEDEISSLRDSSFGSIELIDFQRLAPPTYVWSTLLIGTYVDGGEVEVGFYHESDMMY